MEKLTTREAAAVINEVVNEPDGYWEQFLINNRRPSRKINHRVPYEKRGGAILYSREDLASLIELEKSRRIGGMKLSGRAAEALRAFGVGEKGGSTTGRKLNVSAVTLQLDQATGTRFVQLVTSEPLMVYRLELSEAKALAAELADAAHAGERGAQ